MQNAQIREFTKYETSARCTIEENLQNMKPVQNVELYSKPVQNAQSIEEIYETSAKCRIVYETSAKCTVEYDTCAKCTKLKEIYKI